MKILSIVVGISLSLLSAGALAASDPLLFSKAYRVEANTPYQTNFYQVVGAPVRTDHIYLQQGGAYCSLRIEAVEYMTSAGDLARLAAMTSTSAEYAIPEGVLFAINIVFHQEDWADADCTLYAFARPGIQGGEERFLGVVDYQGGFQNQLDVAIPFGAELTALRVAVPNFCQGAEVLGAGTVVGGLYYGAASLGGGRFAIADLAGRNVSAVRLAINGPRLLRCDVPVYAQFRNDF